MQLVDEHEFDYHQDIHSLLFEGGYIDNVVANSTNFLESLPGIFIPSFGTLSLPLESGKVITIRLDCLEILFT